MSEKKTIFRKKVIAVFKNNSIFAAVLIIKTCSHDIWLQVKGFMNFGFWFLKILASAGIFLFMEIG